MGATERIAEIMKSMHEREIGEMLDFAEFLLAKRVREKAEALATLDKYAAAMGDEEADWAEFEKQAGTWSGKFNREECYDRKVLR